MEIPIESPQSSRQTSDMDLSIISKEEWEKIIESYYQYDELDEL